MAAHDEKTGIEKYAEDLAVIKSMLLKTEEKGIVEPWGFISWGICTLIGSVLHFVFHNSYNLALNDILLKIWAPILIIAILLDSAAHIRKFMKEGIHILSRPLVKIWITSSGIFIGMGLAIFFIVKSGAIAYLPHIILIMFSIFFFLYGYISYFFIHLLAVFLLALSVILYLTGIEADLKFFLTGVILGLSQIICGIAVSRKEKSDALRHDSLMGAEQKDG